jgi:hypothetical protein
VVLTTYKSKRAYLIIFNISGEEYENCTKS